MSLTFYYSPMSTASITEAVINELGIACTRVKLNIQAQETRTPDYLKINPNGRVPAIVHDGTAIWEAAAITMYLGDLFGVTAKLYPAPGPARGEAMKWIAWASVTLAEAAGRLSAAMPAGSAGAVEPGTPDWTPPEMRSAAARDKATADLAACFKVLDGSLAGKTYLVANVYSIADTHVCGYAGWIASMGIELSAYPNVSAWLGRCGGRPAFANLAQE